LCAPWEARCVGQLWFCGDLCSGHPFSINAPAPESPELIPLGKEPASPPPLLPLVKESESPSLLPLVKEKDPASPPFSLEPATPPTDVDDGDKRYELYELGLYAEQIKAYAKDPKPSFPIDKMQNDLCRLFGLWHDEYLALINYMPDNQQGLPDQEELDNSLHRGIGIWSLITRLRDAMGNNKDTRELVHLLKPSLAVTDIIQSHFLRVPYSGGDDWSECTAAMRAANFTTI